MRTVPRKPGAVRRFDSATYPAEPIRGGGNTGIIGRLLGVDYGTRRIGLAISDPARRIASPAGTLNAAGAARSDADRIAAWSAEHEVTAFVVGLPLNMNGTEGPQAARSRAVAEALRRATAMHVELWDERLSSFQADEWMNARELSRAARRKRRDALAAQVILQSYLDALQRGQAPSAEA
ncbi:MAG: Holliday junction resolvase RuvX [Phycisphaerae bacterium]